MFKSERFELLVRGGISVEPLASAHPEYPDLTRCPCECGLRAIVKLLDAALHTWIFQCLVGQMQLSGCVFKSLVVSWNALVVPAQSRTFPQLG